MQVSFTSAKIHSSAIYPNIQTTQQADIAERLGAARDAKAYDKNAYVFEKSYLAKDGIVSEVIVADGLKGKKLNMYQSMLNLINPEEPTPKGLVLKRKYLNLLEAIKQSASDEIVHLPKKLSFTL